MRIHAGGDAILAILAHDIGGERDDGQAFAPLLALELANAPGGGEAVHDGHLAVHEHGVVVRLGEALQGIRAIVGEGDIGREFLQQVLGHALVHGIVFDQQDARPCKAWD